MTKVKKQKRTQKPASFRFDPLVLEVLDKLRFVDQSSSDSNNRINQRPIAKSQVILSCLQYYLARFLKPEISAHQIKSNLSEPLEMFRLFLMYDNAKQGKKGYGFEGFDKKKRFVFGPSGDDTVTNKMTRKMIEPETKKTKKKKKS